jgi:hypothetical protein
MSERLTWRQPRAYWRALHDSSRWTLRDAGKFRWRLWGWACDFLPRGCPANLHSLIIWGYLRNPRIDSVCRQDCALNGGCWCGKLGADGQMRELQQAKPTAPAA